MHTKIPRRMLTLAVGTLTALALSAPPASARALGRVDDYRPAKQRLDMIKDGRLVHRTIASDARVVLRDVDGGDTRADINELVTGAKVLSLRDTDGDGEIEKVILRERASGSSDCSFDYDEEEGDGDGSWDCTIDHDGDDEDVEEHCSYDASGGSGYEDGEGDTTRDVSWDCDYEEADDGDEEGLSWSCSYDASESSSWDASGGDSDGDTSFDCSWESPVPLDSPLWRCAISRDPLGWTCTSEQLEQSFGVTLDGAPSGGFDTFMDFSEDYEDLDEDPVDSTCDANGGGSFSCSYDGDGVIGDCEIGISFDRSFEGDSGDVSGDMSYSCSSGDSGGA